MSLGAEVVAGLSKVEPGTPEGSSSLVPKQRGSSSDEVAAPAGEVHLSEASRLLPQGAGPSAPGLRLRPGQRGAPSWHELDLECKTFNLIYMQKNCSRT